MIARIRPIYPFLFAIIPVLRLVAENPGWMRVDDAVVVVTAVLVTCGLTFGLAFLATRRRGRRLPPLILLGLVLAFWVYVRVAPLVERRTGWSNSVLLPLWVGVTLSVIWWLVRRPALLDRAETFLTLTSGILVGWLLGSIAMSEYRSARAVRHSEVVRRLAEPIRIGPRGKASPKRDIYLIVLDEYANAEVTGRLFGFDNRAFLDSLRQLGFAVPAVHSNYCHTFLSLPSLLNASHIAPLSGELGRQSVDRTIPDYLVTHSRTVSFLKAQGYQYVLFPSLAWEATKGDPRADLVFHPWEGWDLAREMSSSGLRQVVNKTSLLKLVNWRVDQLAREHVARSFAAIAQAPTIHGPVFAFAHVMSPHDPYVFGRDCGPAHHQAGLTRAQHNAAAYVEQIQCVNHMVLKLVTTLLRTSELPPVILLQGDHGSKTLLRYQDRDPEKITLAAAKERLGAFGAYYLPDQGSEVLGDSVTIVNVMGDVLRFYLDAALPRQPDDMYLSLDRTPFAFKRVDYAWLAREDWSERPRRNESVR